ncbi:pyridoxal phosphate-dependent decarboxylase family protein [Streptacidiphilus monticola]
MDAYEELLVRAARLAAAYRASLAARPVAPDGARQALRQAFGGPLPEEGTPPGDVLDQLASAADPGLMGTAGPRYFGFVIGGSLPAAVAADVLTSGWDQCAYNAVLSPAAAAAEEAAGTWLKDLLGLPPTASAGFVTGAQAANTVGLAAGRHHVLAEAGWDVEHDGLHGAPQVRVVAGRERHATIDRSLRLLGFGTKVLEEVGTDANGALDPDDLAAVLAAGPSGPTIVCLQAGNVNTGACDPFPAAIEAAREHGAWVHVDGAFGLWAAANPSTAHLVQGVGGADSWGCDAHKWLNVPYDAGLAFCARPDVHAAAVSYTAAYLVGSGGAAGWGLGDLTTESSRRARGSPSGRH